jgi:hypothetical protein
VQTYTEYGNEEELSWRDLKLLESASDGEASERESEDEVRGATPPDTHTLYDPSPLCLDDLGGA